MFYLFWGLLNIAVWVYLLIIFFRSVKLVREKYGIATAVFLVVGVLSLGASHDSNDTKSLKSWNFISADSLKAVTNFHNINVKMEKTLISDFELYVQYFTDDANVNIPRSANSDYSGFISGVEWKPALITIEKTSDPNKFSYYVTGVVDWKLLNTTLYTQSKTYYGEVSTKQNDF